MVELREAGDARPVGAVSRLPAVIELREGHVSRPDARRGGRAAQARRRAVPDDARAATKLREAGGLDARAGELCEAGGHVSRPDEPGAVVERREPDANARARELYEAVDMSRGPTPGAELREL